MERKTIELSAVEKALIPDLKEGDKFLGGDVIEHKEISSGVTENEYSFRRRLVVKAQEEYFQTEYTGSHKIVTEKQEAPDSFNLPKGTLIDVEISREPAVVNIDNLTQVFPSSFA